MSKNMIESEREDIFERDQRRTMCWRRYSIRLL